MSAIQPVLPENVILNIQENSGQILIGNYIMQLGSGYGALIHPALPGATRLRPLGSPSGGALPASSPALAEEDWSVRRSAGDDRSVRQGQKPHPQPRPTLEPERSLPLPPLFLGRLAETETALQSLHQRQSLGLYGPGGLGKTTLLAYLLHHAPKQAFPDGIVYLSARRKQKDDLLQELFDTFYYFNPQSNLTLKPTYIQIQRALRDKKLLLVLDDVALSRAELKEFQVTLPNCTLLLASAERYGWQRTEGVVRPPSSEGGMRGVGASAQGLPLVGLPLENGLELLETELGRALTSEELLAARVLWAALEGHPGSLRQAAALVRENHYPMSEVAYQSQRPNPQQGIVELCLATLGEPEKAVLHLLAALEGATLSTEHLTALTGLPNTTSLLEKLSGQGLVQAHGSFYRLPRYLGQLLFRSATRLRADPLASLASRREAERRPQGRFRVGSPLRGPRPEGPPEPVEGGNEGGWSVRQGLDLTPHLEHALIHFILWAEAQRSNPAQLLSDIEAILQILAWAVKAERWAEILRLVRAVDTALALNRGWSAWEEVLQAGLQAAQAANNQSAEAWVLHQLGSRALCLGETRLARHYLSQALQLRETLGDKVGVVITRSNLNLLPACVPPPAPTPSNLEKRSLLKKAGFLPVTMVGLVILLPVLALAWLALTRQPGIEVPIVQATTRPATSAVVQATPGAFASPTLPGSLNNHILSSAPPSCLEFDTLPTRSYNPHESFEEAGVVMTIEPLLPPEANAAPALAEIELYGDDFTPIKRLRLQNASLRLNPPPFSTGLSLLFSHLNGNLKLEINGISEEFTNFKSLDDRTIGNVKISVQPETEFSGRVNFIVQAPPPVAATPSFGGLGGPRGVGASVRGEVETFTLGGQELWLDTLCLQ